MPRPPPFAMSANNCSPSEDALKSNIIPPEQPALLPDKATADVARPAAITVVDMDALIASEPEVVDVPVTGVSPHYPSSPAASTGGEDPYDTEENSNNASSGNDLTFHMSEAYRIYWNEAYKCLGMCIFFVVALAHLYLYPYFFDTEVSATNLIPDEELRFFHHGWTAMLVIFITEFFSVALKIWATWHSPVLAVSMAQKLEGNIGVLFGEYIVVGGTYVIMALNLMPVFLEARTGRRVYGVRYMEWTVDVTGLVYLDCHILFGQPWQKFYMAVILSVAYMIFGLWSAIAPTWHFYWAWLMASWLAFFIVCYMLIRFLQQDPKPQEPFVAGMKPCILAFIILWWIWYGVLFMIAFEEWVPQWMEQMLWTGMDVVMKLSHTVVLMAWRASQWDIDAVVKKHKAEGERFLAQLDKERAATERNRMRLLAKINTREMSKSFSDTKGSDKGEKKAVGMAVIKSGEASPQMPLGTEVSSKTNSTKLMEALGNSFAVSDLSHAVLEASAIYKREAFTCFLLCFAFAAALGHLYIYPELFGVEVLPADQVPEQEMFYFHHGWTSMLTIFLIEAISLLLSISATWHQPLVALAQAQKFEGHLGALFGEYLVVGVTYVIMGYNLMPVFIEPRTGRRVYAVRYMEWVVDVCGLVSLDCHCLFNRSFSESKWVFVWSIAYMMFGLWSALASTWVWYWVFLLASWFTFFLACAKLVHFLWKDPYPLEPFNNRIIKPAILSFIIIWWILYGVLFMVAFQAPEYMPQWVEQMLWTGMDVIMKLSHTVVLIAWRATQWDMDTVVSRRRAEREKRKARAEARQIRNSEQAIQQAIIVKRSGAQNWTATPGLAIDLPDIVRLQAEVGQGETNYLQLKSMMSPEEFEELKRLEKMGISQNSMQAKWETQVREQTFLKQGINTVAYDPQNWAQTLLSVHGRTHGSYPCYLIIGVALIVAVIKEQAPDLASEIEISDRIHSLVGGSVMFLVVFRVQYAFRKWWDGRVAFGHIVLYSRTLAQHACAYLLDDQMCKEVVKWVLASVIATRCHLRNSRIDPLMVLGILDEHEIQELNAQANMPYYATWMVRSSIAAAVSSGKYLPFHMAMDNALRALEEAISDAERLLTPMPFVYVAHLRSFLFLYLLFLPFVLVSDLGRLMVCAVAVASYLLIGLENTAVTLENPFGHDLNDLPLDLYCIEVSRDLLGLIELRAKHKKLHRVSVNTDGEPIRCKPASGNMDDGGDDD